MLASLVDSVYSSIWHTTTMTSGWEGRMQRKNPRSGASKGSEALKHLPLRVASLCCHFTNNPNSQSPYIVAQYDWGHEETLDLSNSTTAQQIESIIKDAAQRVPHADEVAKCFDNTKDVEGWVPSGEREYGLPSACMDGARKRDASTL